MKREEGHYWVKINDDWVIAEYKPFKWHPQKQYVWEYIWNNEIRETHEGSVIIEEIDENKITRDDDDMTFIYEWGEEDGGK